MQVAARLALLGALVAVPRAASAQMALPPKHKPTRTQTAITPADLMTRLYLYADDSMMGRMAGSEYNLKATAYIAAEAQRMGLRPAGDSGGYFQNVPLVKRGLDASSTLSVDGMTFKPWDEFVPRDPGRTTRGFQGAQVVYAGVWPDSTMLSPEQATGKFLVIGAHSGPNVPQAQQINRGAILSRYRGAAGIAVAALETFPAQVIGFFRQPQTLMKNDAPPGDTTGMPAYVYVNAAGARALLGASIDSVRPGAAGKTVHGSVTFSETPAPARNVVAMLPGSDATLRGEYVAIGAHNDHVGFNQNAMDHDSIRAFNEAVRRLELASANHQVSQDQIREIHAIRSTTAPTTTAPARVSVLEIAEAFAKREGEAEALAALRLAHRRGGRASTARSTSPIIRPCRAIRSSRSSTWTWSAAARATTGDHKEGGRHGGPGYVQLIGSRRLSTELGDLVESVNRARSSPLTFDYSSTRTGIRRTSTAAAITTSTRATAFRSCSSRRAATRLPPGDRRAAVHRLRPHGAGGARSCTTSRRHGREPRSPVGGRQAEAGSGGGIRRPAHRIWSAHRTEVRWLRATRRGFPAWKRNGR
jgi:hypothetical protein